MSEDLEVLGNRTISGGEYNNIDVLGELRCEGRLEANDIDIMGKASFYDNVLASDVNIMGKCYIEGNLKAKEINIMGEAKIQGNVESDEIEIYGKVEVTGDINADEIEIYSAQSNFNNIYGEEVVIGAKVNKKHHRFEKINVSQDNRLGCNINEIEATNITLAYAKVKRVSGENIVIEENVEVDLVEYSHSLEVSKYARIKKIVKF